MVTAKDFVKRRSTKGHRKTSLGVFGVQPGFWYDGIIERKKCVKKGG